LGAPPGRAGSEKQGGMRISREGPWTVSDARRDDAGGDFEGVGAYRR
jgi:hypothetical protein